jgi:hypothetical protein
MPLQSMWFRRNARLEQCLISDPFHVKRGDNGEHVTLIQGALLTLDKSEISNDEQRRQTYDHSTAKAVLEYKKKRNIINFSYQTSADDIVGRMTMRSLDTEMVAYEGGIFRLLLLFGVPSPPRGEVISQSNPTAAAWARQVVAANHFLVNNPSSQGTPKEIVEAIRKAIQAAGRGGLLIFAVGHGITDDKFPAQGKFDLADQATIYLTARFLGFRCQRDRPAQPHHDSSPKMFRAKISTRRSVKSMSFLSVGTTASPSKIWPSPNDTSKANSNSDSSLNGSRTLG